MTAKERLPDRVRGLSDTEVAETLRLVDARHDPLNRRLDDPSLEDEDISAEEAAMWPRRVTAARAVVLGRSLCAAAPP